MSVLTKLEWHILDSLADDTECLSLILSMKKDELSDISQMEIAKSVHSLCQQGLIYEDNNKTVVLQSLINEPEDYKKNLYWFGLTDLGSKIWEEYAPIYSDVPIDWSKAYVGYLDYYKREGYIDGASEEICLEQLDKFDRENIKWQIDRNSLVRSQIDFFEAKYHKILPGGF